MNQRIDRTSIVNQEHTDHIVQLVNTLIQNAITQKASDIHLESFEHHCRIRFRCHGVLQTIETIPLPLATRIMTRLKIMADMNIAERRLPQDGRLNFQFNHKIDMRINSSPTVFGEKLVIRILNSHSIKPDLHSLGLTTEQKSIVYEKLSQPDGLILVTGPTGSGKSITLYSALMHLNDDEKNIMSIEDPVEMELYGINQLNINVKIGLDFSVAFRGFLRQDPDVIMIGEIRDIETATIAMQASQTGHLVLSTLHTNSVIETMIRLQSMNIDKHQLIHSLSLITSQRLIRKLCAYCKQTDVDHYSISTKKTQKIVYKAGVQCTHCHQGYDKRTGIFEVLPITNTIRQAISSNANHEQLRNIIQDECMLLWDAGLQKMNDGITSVAEIIRVLGRDEFNRK